ncbi:MAG TPA: cytochrome c peroxidase [Bradyrhizobium sp.]|uniref:cytochrome-c peroxidase n=1 Tax=Bradyrhizobium sp. TaxID=376 RepID=UPI002D7F05FB|nr:cytochrome c peroxidase [Bradyrhizobium sp.]HET7886280.1 cytochrome c peroxidase [Bradyrhizobium sp.]
MKNKSILRSALAGVIVLSYVAAAQRAPAQSVTPPQLCSAQIDIMTLLPGGAKEDPDVARVNAEIDRVFAGALRQAQHPMSLDPYHQLALLGTLALYDKNLSVAKNLACVSCHTPETGFTGGVSLWNKTIVAQPGSVADTIAARPAPNFRISARKPQSYGYAPLAPVLEYNAAQHVFVGGNFWDMRATGLRLGNPAAAQAEGPPVNPLEMALPDTACVVYRLSQSGYRRFFEQVWGAQSFAIRWPANVEKVCSIPAPPPANDPLPVHLSAVDRGTSNSTFDHFALSIAADESSADVSPFSSRFDYALAHPQGKVLSSEEFAGWQLFRGKGKCNTCHLDGTESVSAASEKRTPTSPDKLLAAEQDPTPLFTEFQAHNLGIPANPALPFDCETKPDQHGYVANPLGTGFVDQGAGAFLAGALNPNKQWAQYAPKFDGTFQTPTLRNVDLRPRPDFVKAYMHNGYFKSLKEVVHFYNTRDVLPKCTNPLDPRAGTGCWPAPEVSANESKTIGNLGLSDQEENSIVAFMKTLTDGYIHVTAPGDSIGASVGSMSTARSP